MKYIQKEFGGKLRGFNFNQGAHVEVQLKNGTNINNVAKYYYAVLWGGLIGNCIVKETDPDFTWEQVIDWADALDPVVAEEITQCYLSTLPKVEDKKKEVKKHLPQKSTKSKVSK